MDNNIATEWFRMPSRGNDPIFGLSRAWYYNAIKKGQIISASLKQGNSLRGVRLINVRSVRELIEKSLDVSERPQTSLTSVETL